MKEKLISVIIPTYNRERTIQRAINSVLNQSYKDIELIIVDDCSTDKTCEIVNKYKDERIKYFKLEKNYGACYARNYGVNKASGKYIAFQDSDDEWSDNKLEIQLKNMIKNNSDIDFCEYEKYDGISCTKFPKPKEKKNIEKYGIEKALRYGNFISTQLILLKRECFEYYMFDNSLPRLQDYDLILVLSSKFSISFTKISLVKVYVQNDSISQSPEKLQKAINIMLTKKYNWDKILFSQLYVLLASNCKNKNEKRKYYIKALRMYFNIKTFIKLIINY